jgi:hypothetical protein
MSYMDINNLYKDADILLFKECFAMCKVHGTSAHVSWKEGQLHLFPGGEKMANFEKTVNKEQLIAAFTQHFATSPCVVFGEAYGGKCQGMKDTYGPDLKFIAFEVKIGDSWLAVPQAEDVAVKLGFEFVPYTKITTDMDKINAERDRPSIVAERRGMGSDKKREGIVLRPPIEVIRNNGSRIIAKHKQDWARETKTVRTVDPLRLAIITNAVSIAEEFVTPMRLEHVLQELAVQGIEATGVEHTRQIILAMITDVAKESKGETTGTVETDDTIRKAIGTKTAQLWKQRIEAKFKEEHK